VRPVERADLRALLEMFAELAEYERLTHELLATEELLARAFFSETPQAGAVIAEEGGRAVGYAVFHTTFSSFLAAQGIWLEDLYVRPEHRTAGVGRALVAAVAAHTLAHGCRRLEWVALDWNERALRFYADLDATKMDDWIPHRLDCESLERLAAEAR
jgi:GNAT superfamily N-acetyltransferase